MGVSYATGLLLVCLYQIGSSLPSPQQTGLSPLATELDGLLAGAGGIPSVDLEKRAPMRFGKRAPMRFGKRDYEDSDPADLIYEDMYFDKRAPMRFGKRSDDYY